jgi:hypothetical protein
MTDKSPITALQRSRRRRGIVLCGALSCDYGNAQDTEILAVPLSVKIKKGDFFVRASIPYLHIKATSFTRQSR